MTLTGDEVRKRLKQDIEDGVDWRFVEDVTDTLAELADRINTVDELTPSFHTIARLEARIAALEQKLGSGVTAEERATKLLYKSPFFGLPHGEQIAAVAQVIREAEEAAEELGGLTAIAWMCSESGCSSPETAAFMERFAETGSDDPA